MEHKGPQNSSPPSFDKALAKKLVNQSKDEAVSALLQMVERFNLGLAAFDRRESCVFCTPFVSELMRRTEFSQTEFFEMITGAGAEQKRLWALSNDARNGKTPPLCEVQFAWNDETYAFFVDIFLLEDDSDTVVVTMQDSHGGSRLRKELERLASLAAIGQATAGVAHEFNNIITSVLGWAQIALQSSNKQEIVDSALEIIEGNARRAKAIAARVLDTSNQDSTEEELLCLDELIDDIIKLFSWELNSQKIELDLHCKAKGPFVGNGYRVGQVFINLIRNAIDAMNKGGKLTVKVTEKQDQSCITFRDTGEGIRREDISRIFEPFFTTKKRLKDSLGGTGLGLSICQDIIEEHGGTLCVESELKKGSQFTICLPKKALPESTGERDKPSKPPLDNIVTVLVADDQPDVGDMIHTALSLKGANVFIACSGIKALELCDKTQFDIAFIDFSMPGKNGLELAKDILIQQPDCPVVLMSGRVIEMDPTIPIADFLKKPFDLNDIQQKLRTVISAKAKRNKGQNT